MNLLIRSKDGLQVVETDFQGKCTGVLHTICSELPRQSKLASNGKRIAYSTNNQVVLLEFADAGPVEIARLSLSLADFSWSPSGTFFCSYEKLPQTGVDTSSVLNLSIWKIIKSDAGPAAIYKLERIAAFSHKNQNTWNIHWTGDESYYGRLVTGEAQFFKVSSASNLPQPTPSFRLIAANLADMAISPGLYPKAAVFIKEGKDSPAAVRIFLLPNTTAPIAQKMFFKADRISLSWSPNGKHLLALTATDVDQSNQSYYGENNLYFLAGDGSFDCKVDLDKEGPVHDVNWASKGNEFIVIYGYMPSKATLFDLKCEAIFEFPLASSMNHIRYNPQGSLICFGGFGNLPGNVEVWCRGGSGNSTGSSSGGGSGDGGNSPALKRVNHFQAAGSSICEWSPSGHAILTATVTPRLRVDNGFKLWHWRGSSPIEIRPSTELYQAAWQFNPLDSFPALDLHASIMNNTSSSSIGILPKKEAYRPPGLRNSPTNSATSPTNPSHLAAAKLAKKSNPESSNCASKENACVQAASKPTLSKEEKMVKKIQEKLEQIKDLKVKLASGEQLELNQLEKIKKEKALNAELDIALAALKASTN